MCRIRSRPSGDEGHMRTNAEDYLWFLRKICHRHRSRNSRRIARLVEQYKKIIMRRRSILETFVSILFNSCKKKKKKLQHSTVYWNPALVPQRKIRTKKKTRISVKSIFYTRGCHNHFLVKFFILNGLLMRWSEDKIARHAKILFQCAANTIEDLRAFWHLK